LELATGPDICYLYSNKYTGVISGCSEETVPSTLPGASQ